MSSLMHRNVIGSQVICALISGIMPIIAQAGSNAGGTVRLSWAVDRNVESIAVPATRTFPLFVEIRGAPDVGQLALDLRWMPHDSTSACYTVVSARPQASTGWVTNARPSGPFEGDSSYRWSIAFPSGMSERKRVVYWFSMADCDSTLPAKFFVADARVRDSRGAVDTLRNVGDAKLIGGRAPSSIAEPTEFVVEPTSAQSRSMISVTPNPGRDYILIRFVLPQPMTFALGIYDLSGRLVRLLTTGPANAQAGDVKWNLGTNGGTRVAAGRYYARLITRMGISVAPLTVLP